MNGKAHSLEMVSTKIEIAQEYVHEPDLQRGIVRQCHQEIGLNVIGAPARQWADIPDQAIALGISVRFGGK